VYRSDKIPQVKRKKASVAIIIVAFILGLILGYVANDITITKDRYTFESGENILLNSGFEVEIEEGPAYWYQAIIPAENLTMSYEKEEVYSGSRSICIKNTHIYDEEVCNNWAQTISIVPFDRFVELSGWVKTIDAESVVMVIQCWDENNKLVGFGTTQSETNISGTLDWTQYSASVKVPEETEFIIVRLVLTGQVWFDDVTLVVK
jgi:hypothetical protein